MCLPSTPPAGGPPPHGPHRPGPCPASASGVARSACRSTAAWPFLRRHAPCRSEGRETAPRLRDPAARTCRSSSRDSGDRDGGGISTGRTAVIGGTCALRRHHQRANRTFRRAFPAEQLALLRLEHPFQHFSTLRRHWIADVERGHLEAALGVPLG